MDFFNVVGNNSIAMLAAQLYYPAEAFRAVKNSGG
jgi:hypothetical protein